MKGRYKIFSLQIKPIILLSVISIVILNIEFFPQIKPEFIISDSASLGDMVFDSNNNIHIVLDRRNDIIYRKYDSLFNPLSEFKAFNNTLKTALVKTAIRNNYMVTVWEDFSLQMFFNSEIMGNISNINDNLNPENFLVNDEYYDAYRGNPKVCFINDTSFIVIWTGNGPYTVGTNGFYGRIFSVSGNPLTSDILINDRYNDISRAVVAKILYNKNSNKLFSTWVSNYSGKYILWGRLFYSNGTPVDSSFRISEESFIDDLFYYDTALDSSGNFVAAWAIAKRSNWELQWKWYNSNGESLTSIETISNTEDSVVSFSLVNISISKDGKSILVWDGGKEEESKKYAKRFSSDRKQIGNIFRISENDSTFEASAVFILNTEKIFCLWRADSDHWFGTFGEILDFNNPTEIIEDNKISINPNSFNLYQNYPNPFNPTTNIQYSIREPGFVTIKVYDMLGREIETLVNEEKSIGIYTITFDAISLASGIYFYHIQAGSFVQTKKMIHLR